MALPEIYQDYMKLQELQQQSEEHKAELTKAYEELGRTSYGIVRIVQTQPWLDRVLTSIVSTTG